MTVFTIGSEILHAGGLSFFPQVAPLAGGGAVIVWGDDSQTAGDPDGLAVLARVFGADGAPVASRFVVNTTLASHQYLGQVTGLSNGGFVVSWEDDGADTSVESVRAQVFTAAGTPVGSEIAVNTITAGAQTSPQIIALSNGGFAVTWTDLSQTAPDTSGAAVRTQVFAADGTRVGTEILVNTTTAAGQSAPQIGALAGGGFAIAWQDLSLTAPDTTGAAVRAQVFAADGTRVGGEILANTATAGAQTSHQITGLAGGGFVVTWQDASRTAPDATGAAVRAQVFAADGAAVGTEILVNTATAGDQRLPQIKALSDGGFVVAWADGSLGVGGAGGDASSTAVKAQVFSATGAPRGGEILVNTATANAQQSPEIAALADGRFVIAWQDASLTAPDTSGTAVRVQVFDAQGTALGSEVLVNTGTADFQSAPQIAPLDAGFIVIWRTDVNGQSAGSILTQVFGLSNFAPRGTDGALSADEGVARVLAVGDFGFRDSEGDDLAAVRITTLPSGGTLTHNGVAVTAGQSVSAADIAAGRLAFTPAAAGTASFTFQVQDDGGVADSGVDLDASPNTLTFNVAAAPPPPPPAPPPATPTAGAAGADTVTLSIDPDRYAAGAGDDWTFGGGGGDTLQGNAGADILYGDAGDDLLYGGKDDDVVDGGVGDDRLYGDLGNDTLTGGNGADVMEGGDGDDRISGDYGSDLAQGGVGNDRLDGGEGADTLRGGQGNDLVQGAAGNDWLSGDRGDDTLTGGAGADIFHSFAGAGIDWITDFNRAEGDRLQLEPGVTYSIAQVGADTVVTLGGGGQVVLASVQVSTLGDGWIFGV